jgi:hypothetical protein
MPVVSRSDCTQIDIEVWTKIVNDGSVAKATEHTEIAFNACTGIDDNDNDLEAHFELLVEDGIMTEDELEILSATVVGEDNCEDAISEFLAR